MVVRSLRFILASVVGGALTFAAMSDGRAKLTDRVPMDVDTVVEKTPAAEGAAEPQVSVVGQLQRFLALQSSALNLRPWQYDAWSRYSAAFSMLLAPLTFLPQSYGDPIAASKRFADEVAARAAAASSLALAADDLHSQLRPEQIVRASSLIPPPWRLISRADAVGTSNSAETLPPQRTAERVAGRIEP